MSTKRQEDMTSCGAPAQLVAHVGLVGGVEPRLTPDQLAGLIDMVGSSADKKAFAALFGYYAPRLKSFLGRRGFASSECEDLVQEVMLNLWRKAFGFDRSKASASTWVYTIARNVGVDRRAHGGADCECICLTAIEGPMRIKGVIGKLIQPFLGL